MIVDHELDAEFAVNRAGHSLTSGAVEHD